MEENNFSYQFYKTTADAWEAMYQSLLTAQKSIFWEVYIFVDDEAGNRFVNLLAEKAKAGLEVKLIVDALGSSKLSSKAEKFLTSSGVVVLRYSRYHPQLKFWNFVSRLMHRNHRKVLIVDKKIVFLGGVNIKADFKDWDDIFIKLTGKIAWPLMKGFARSYISSGGQSKDVRRLLYPYLGQGILEQVIPDLSAKLKFIVHSPSKAKLPRTKLFYLKALTIAKERVNLLSPYYIPDGNFLRGIAIATARGVQVNIFLPHHADVQLMELLSRTYFDLTIRAGANIYLLPKMNHGKALTVDGQLGLVGSINLMPRSFSYQEESAVSFTDEKMVSELNGMFDELKAQAEPLNIDAFRRRHWLQHLREWLAKKLEYFV
ncbi:MAG: phosphatidylserine/phosphatidylglycerophosphate/cardiolipin synthase family protein [Patescibacteria group bacterium]|jgi:cardiolipin synthase